MLKLRQQLAPVSSTTILVRISEIRQVNTFQEIPGHPRCHEKLPTTAPPAFSRHADRACNQGSSKQGPPESCQTRFLFRNENTTSHFLLVAFSFAPNCLFSSSSPVLMFPPMLAKTTASFLLHSWNVSIAHRGLLRNVWQLLVPPFQASYDDLVSARTFNFMGR